MKIKSGATAAVAVVLLGLGMQSSADAQVVGHNSINVPANSDVIVAVPFNRAIEATLTVASISGLDVTVSEAVSAGTYNNTYYVRVISGPAAGLWSTITSTPQANKLTLNNAAVAGLLAGGDAIRVYKHQTLSSVFTSDLNGVSYRPGTQVLVFDNSVNTQNKSTSATVTYNTIPAPAWVGAQGANTVLKPDTAFIVRNNDASPLTFISSGSVPDYPVSYLIPGGVATDLVVGTGYPVKSTISGLGFGGVAGRQVLVFDNTLSTQNKASSDTITYNAIPVPSWVGAQGALTELPAATGFILRKYGSDAGGKITSVKPY